MTLKQFNELTGNEYLAYNGMAGSIGKDEIFEIVKITKYYWDINLDKIKDNKYRKKCQKMNGTIMGGSIMIRRTDGLPMDKSKWNYTNKYVNESVRCCDYRLLKVVKTNDKEES